MNQIVYIKIGQNTGVKKKKVLLSDIAKLHCVDEKIKNELENITVLEISSGEPGIYSMTFMRIVELIHEKNDKIRIVNEGEKDFLIDYDPGNDNTGSKAAEYIKAALVCIISFFAAAFTIMAFNTDADVVGIFDKIYLQLMNSDKAGAPSVIEFSYCIGLPIGILVFFNHFSKKKLTTDPTPIHIEMRKYEKETNEALIQDASREGKTIDIS